MLAQRELLAAAKGIRDEFDLGPRGTWILGLIATGRIKTQADVVKRYKLGRSIIAEEMALLTKAGLVACTPHESDRRQITVSLTESGVRANTRMGRQTRKVYLRRSSLLHWSLGGLGTSRVSPMSWRGFSKRVKSPISAVSVVPPPAQPLGAHESFPTKGSGM
jgi:DNA-binding MarR family transcriptional regulator